MTHKHHIMPRHLGGTNDPDNLVEVSVEEHARIHHSLWILGGRWQDEIAWRMLSGQISRKEAIKQAQKRSAAERIKNRTHNFLGGEISRRTQRKRIEAGTHHFLDREAARQRELKKVKEGTHQFLDGRISKEITHKRIADGTHNFIGGKYNLRVHTCPYCGKVGKSPAMKRWHFNNCKTKGN